MSLSIGVKEQYPDNAGAGTAAIGDITNAELSAELVPLVSGGSITLTCVPGTASGTGHDTTLAFVCTSARAIPLGTHEVVVNVTGTYYTGTYGDAFTVYDPSLGFATGGGHFALAGDKVSFGFTMKYNRRGTSLRGGLIAVRHHPDGTVSRIKSDALGGLVILDSGGCGIATFSGRATYTTWEPIANGGFGAYATTGNNTFSVRADDCNNPGSETDKIWIGGPGDLAMAGPASSNLAPLDGGDIAVPHRTAGR